MNRKKGAAGKNTKLVATIPPTMLVATIPPTMRGEAYLAAHEGGEAAVEFQKILDYPGVVANEPIGALARCGLARAYAMTGDTAAARTKYKDFIKLWKDAAPNVPSLRQARIDFAKLR
jgi:hypothetical protein